MTAMATTVARADKLELSFGDVRQKQIQTPNDFVSHMLEHVAWRMGLRIELQWNRTDWRELGRAVGEKISHYPARSNQAAALGMIDDGSAEVLVSLGHEGIDFSGSQAVDLQGFLGSRCEQVDSGQPLQELLEGLAVGLHARIEVKVGNYEDPHHTWEGIYRAVGIALARIYTPVEEKERLSAELARDLKTEANCTQGELSVLERGVNRAVVRRGTAETGVTVGVDFGKAASARVTLDVGESIRAALIGIDPLFTSFARALGAELAIDFQSKKLSSSHVVMEDIGLVMGRALLEVLKLRMEKYGLNGAGSNVHNASDMSEGAAAVGISVEGRKFWRFVPQDGDFARLKGSFLIGQTVLGGLRSEDLDDFIDGLAGGLSASVMVHLRDWSDPGRAWQNLFEGVGSALREAFEVNPFRRGVPPGVKATLA
jgi:imidazoleglycerol phosphate dehydratase HisB